MVDAPKYDDEEQKDAPKACSLEKQSKRRHKRRPKSRLDRNNDHTDPVLEKAGRCWTTAIRIIKPNKQILSRIMVRTT